jgi:hypothetical protein
MDYGRDVVDEEERDQSPRNPSGSPAGSLAGLLLADKVNDGSEVEIPSLGVTITKDDLAEDEVDEYEAAWWR